MMKKITLMIMAVALAACTTQTSPERHARHFAYNASETMNGNMVTDRGHGCSQLTEVSGYLCPGCGRQAKVSAG
jgi:hypothetical protein